jgi:DNA helicase HerA-like ATPase
MILVGAQQTASEVERRVIANSSLRVAGRLDPAEAMRPEYGFLSTVHRERARIAKPGTMFVMQPEIPVPLVAEFPFPAWATRPSERAGPDPSATGAARPPDDVFRGLPGSSGAP